MRVSEMPNATKKEEQNLLFSYYDVVLVDFDSLPEVKKIKKPIPKGTKKPGNK